MTLQDNVIKGFFQLFERAVLIVCRHPVKLDGRSCCGSEDIAYLICQVTLQERVIKGSYDFMEGGFLLYTPPCQFW